MQFVGRGRLELRCMADVERPGFVRLTVHEQRSAASGIGFSAQVKNREKIENVGELLLDVEPEDLVKYGLIPEFVGRLPVDSRSAMLPGVLGESDR